MSGALMALNTADLKGMALDWAAAKAFDQTVEIVEIKHTFGTTRFLGMHPREASDGIRWQVWSPQTHRSQAWKLYGSYIERIAADSSGGSITTTAGKTFADENIFATVCRAFVAYTLGDSVEIPAELIDEASA